MGLVIGIVSVSAWAYLLFARGSFWRVGGGSGYSGVRTKPTGGSAADQGVRPAEHSRNQSVFRLAAPGRLTIGRRLTTCPTEQQSRNQIRFWVGLRGSRADQGVRPTKIVAAAKILLSSSTRESSRSARVLLCSSTVTAVIPARDEAASIAQAVESLRLQTHRLKMVVVDDNSADRTGDIAREHGACVVNGGPLPPGWTGKMWAVWQGVEAALVDRPDYVLLTDADIVHAPENVAQLVARAEMHRFDLVSLMVLLRTESFAERALMPAFVFFFLMLYPPKWIPSRRHRTAGAAGGCMLIRREMLERIGGVSTIRGELIDDCALARAVKREGGSVWLGLTRETRSIREYGGFGPIWRMISRTAFTQLHYSALMLMATVAGLAIVYLAPPILATRKRRSHAIPGAASWLLMSVAYAPTLRLYRLPLFWAPALPLIALFYMGATVDSAIRYCMGRGGDWKGRTQAGLLGQ